MYCYRIKYSKYFYVPERETSRLVRHAHYCHQLKHSQLSCTHLYNSQQSSMAVGRSFQYHASIIHHHILSFQHITDRISRHIPYVMAMATAARSLRRRIPRAALTREAVNLSSRSIWIDHSHIVVGHTNKVPSLPCYYGWYVPCFCLRLRLFQKVLDLIALGGRSDAWNTWLEMKWVENTVINLSTFFIFCTHHGRRQSFTIIIITSKTWKW